MKRTRREENEWGRERERERERNRKERKGHVYIAHKPYSKL